jgi:hypothetical protein
MDNLLFKIAVFGPGDELFIWWGHAALIVENTKWNISRVFDWGIFTYPSDSFIRDFIREQVRYKCTANYFYMDDYIEEDRDITIYTLNLDRKAKEIILAYAEKNIMPENCYYDYHEFRDNCATRIRDIVDMGTGGQLKTFFSGVPGRYTIRQHIRRYTWFRPFSDWFLNFMMGQNLDEKITSWDEMFLPVEIARNIVGFTYTDNSGVERKLVESVQIFNTSKERPPVLNKPLAAWPFALTWGLIAAALLFSIKALGRKYPVCGRILWGVIQSFLGLFWGGSGCVLVFGFLMNNDYFQQNMNILFINPLLLFMVPLGILYAANKHFPINRGCSKTAVFGTATLDLMEKTAVRRFFEELGTKLTEFWDKLNAEKLLRIIWTGVFITGSITVILQVFPFFYQQNQNVLGVFLPVTFAFSHIPRIMTAHIFNRAI